MRSIRMRRLPSRLRPLEETLLFIVLALGGGLLALLALDARVYFTVSAITYTPLHTLLEMAAILVSFSVFIVNWESSKQSRNAQSLFIATGFVTVAAADLMHTLSNQGMPVFVTPNTTDKSIYYFLFARYWAAGILLAAAFVRPSSRGVIASRRFLAGANIVVSLLLFAVVTGYSEHLPGMYSDALGLTTTKIVAEYGIMLISLLAATVHAHAYRKSGDASLAILVCALAVGVFSELALTLFRNPSDIYSVLGHIYKVVAYYLIFRALLVSSVERPYVQLQQAKESLERTVVELNRRTRELDALDEVALTLSSSLRPDELLPSAIEKVMGVMQAEAGAIFLTEEQTGQLKLSAWRGLKATAVAQYQARSVRVPYGGSPLGPVMTTLEDPAHMRTLGGSEARIAPLRACVCAPVTTKGQMLGSIAMIAGPDRAFSPTDADLLTAVGYQLGLAIENARLYDRTDEQLREKLRELERAERESSFLAEAAALLAGSMDLGKVLDMVARKSTEVVGDWCAIYLLDEREGLLHPEAVFHSDQEELATLRRLMGRNPVRLGEGIVGEVALSGEPVLVVGERLQRFTSELQGLVESVEEVAVLHRILPSSAIVAPMRARGKTVGVLLVLETHTSEVMGESEMGLVAQLCDRAGASIENSQLFQESQAQRRHLEAVISQMVDGVVIADAEGKLLVANAAADQMLRGQFGGLVDLLPVGSEEPQETAGSNTPIPLIRRALQGESLLGEEIIIAGEAGERVLSASATAIKEDLGRTTGAVVVLRDVTVEREIDRMKDEFVATVSHELRTPITAVLGYTDLMLRGLRGPLTQPQTDALNSVRNAGHRLLKLIEDLLDISKLEAGKQELLLEVVSAHTAVSRAITSVAFMASAKKITLVQDLPRPIPLVIADEDQLQRILANLLSNAVKFTPEGGTITVRAYASGRDNDRVTFLGPEEQDWVTLTVADTGPGIPIDMQSRIWEKFQQVDSSSSRAYGGTGLGLAIVKGLVELHGGRVWVESDGIDGHGSSFSFTLPTVRSLPPTQ